MNYVLVPRVQHDLADTYKGCKQGMVCEEQIVKIYLTSFFRTDKVALRAIDGVEHEASEVHGYEIEVHSLNTASLWGYLLTLKLV